MTTIETAAAPAPIALVPALLRLAGPVALARLGIMGMGIVDTIVVGQLAPHELGFLALGWAPTSVVLVTGLGLLTGVQVLGARVVGEGRPRAAGAVWRKGLMLGALTSVVFGVLLWVFADAELRVFGIEPHLTAGAARVTRALAFSLPFQLMHLACSSFLESIKRPLAGTIVIWVANGVNLALNLTFVPHWGAVGAAYATIGARSFMLAALFAWIMVSTAAREHGAHDRDTAAITYRQLLGVGVASAVSQIAEVGAFNVMSIMAAQIGAQAIAAYQILLMALAVVFMIALGFSSAAAVLVSEAYGRGDQRSAARAGWLALGLNTAGMAVCAAAILICAPLLARAFTSEVALAAIVTALLPLCALIVLPDGGQTVMAQALRGRADNWFPSASHVFAYVLVMPLLGYYFADVRGAGLGGLMWAIALASMLSVGVLIARFAFLARQTPSTQPSSRSTD